MSRLSASPDKSPPSTMGSPGVDRSVFSLGTTPATETEVDPLAGMNAVAGSSGSDKHRFHVRVPEPRRRTRQAAAASLSDQSEQEAASSDEDSVHGSLSRRLDRLIHLSNDLLAVSRFANGIETDPPGVQYPVKEMPYVHRRLQSQTSMSAKGSPTTASAAVEEPIPERATPSKKAKDVGQLLKAAMEDNVLDEEGSFFDVRARNGSALKGFAGSDILATPPEPKDARAMARSQLVRPSISPIKISSSTQVVASGAAADKAPDRNQRWSLPFGIGSGLTVSRSHLSLQSESKSTSEALSDPASQALPRSPISPRSSFNSTGSAGHAPSTPSGRSEATQAASPTLVTRTSYAMLQDGRSNSTQQQEQADDDKRAHPKDDSPAKTSIVDLLRSLGSKVGS